MTDVEIHDHFRVQHVTLNRPVKRNALTLQMCKDIVAAVKSAEARDDIGCTLISANGPVFCSGMDFSEHAPADELLKVHEQLFTLGAQAKKPIVIGVNGGALAGGMGLVAQGHLVHASSNAMFSLPEVRLGLWPFLIYRSVEAAIGSRRALELSLTGATVDVEQALAWGLVHRIHPVAEIHAASKSVAREVAKGSPAGMAAGMEYIREAAGKSAAEAGQIAARLRAALMETPDYHEGVAAFHEKREPRWPSIAQEFYAKVQADRS